MKQQFKKLFPQLNIFPKLILCLIFLVILIVLGSIGVRKFSNHNQSSALKENPTRQPDQSELIVKILKSQAKLAKELTLTNASKSIEISRSAALVAPFGPLNPVASAETSNGSGVIVNIINGYHCAREGIPKANCDKIYVAPLVDGQNAQASIEKTLATQQKALTDLADSFIKQPQLVVIADWPSGLSRYNEYFVDRKQNLGWTLPISDGYYDYDQLKLERDAAQINKQLTKIVDPAAAHQLTSSMQQLNIQTLYKCNDQVIIMISATTDNGYGWVYSPNTPKSPNCGVLEGRFEVVIDQLVDPHWRFWVGR